MWRGRLDPGSAERGDLIERFAEELPGKLITREAQEMGRARAAEMGAYLAILRRETCGFEILVAHRGRGSGARPGNTWARLE